ncbi:MAG: SusC/RagA family TonB-linked outer membrane protein [Bacteroidota bacterium]
MYKNYTKELGIPYRYITKLLLIMRLTTLMLIVTLMQVSAAGLAQKVSLNKTNASLKSVLTDIRRQSGYDYVVTETVLTIAKPVSINIKDANLKDALDRIFSNQSLTYFINNTTITVKEAQRPLFDKDKKALKAIDVRGKVVDPLGNAIPGATVTVKGKDKSQATATDNNGNFSLTNVDDNAVLVISSIGYLSLEITVKPEMGTIALEVSNSKLDEIVVVGYGTTTKRLSTGSVSHVKGAEIEQQPISNPILGLAGRVPGAFITQTAGYAGAQFNIQIRGQNSISALNINNGAPLYVIDGVPFSSTPVEQTAGTAGLFSFSPLNTIDPTNIESIDVLKDADATAIYGSRGANGVILITTKKGKSGNTNVNVDLSSGFGNVTNTVPLLGTSQFLDVRRQAFANDGITPTAANAPDLFLFDQNAYTDFTKLVLGNTQHQSRAVFDLSGGDQFTQFLFGGNYRQESTVLPSNTADKATQLHLNLQHKSHDNKFGVSVGISYNVDNNTIPTSLLLSNQYGLPPNYPVYNSSGALNFTGSYGNPLAPFFATYSLKSKNLISNTTLRYTIAPGLDLKLNAGYNNDIVNSTIITPVTASNPAGNPVPTVTLGNNYINTYIVEPQINYTHTWGKGRLTALAGGTWQESQFVQPYYIIGTYTNIQLVNSLSSITITNKLSGEKDYKYVSGFGRMEYEWDGKYLVSANIRRDGSSRFGDNKAFGNFGSGALAWIFSNEGFVRDNLPWLSFGKLKASYGSVGNDKTLSDYQYLSTYTAGAFPYGTTPSLAPTNISNPYLQWEQTKKLDIAMDLGFMQDRIFFSATYYRNRTSHLLANQALPTQDGFGSYSANLPDGAIVQNKGVELELATVNIKHNAFRWNSSVNFSVPQNKLLAFPDILTSNYANTYVVGQPLNVRFRYHFTGFVDGVATAGDTNNDGIITAGYSATGKADFVMAGSSDPKYYGGVDNTFTYKGLTLNFLFQFVKRTAPRGDLLGYPGTSFNIAQSILDLPFKYSATTGAAYPTNFYTRYSNSDAAIQDASFLRLKNVALSYSVPQAWAKKAKMTNFQIYLHAQNLLTFTPYKGYDPETLSTTALPTLRMVVAGIRASL